MQERIYGQHSTNICIVIYIYIYKCYIKRFAIVKQKAKACSKNMCHKICIKKKREREKKYARTLKERNLILYIEKITKRSTNDKFRLFLFFQEIKYFYILNSYFEIYLHLSNFEICNFKKFKCKNMQISIYKMLKKIVARMKKRLFQT